jgi:hypothetical protein
MGWSIGFDSNWNRDIGYGVPAYCDHPKCSEEIDRGLSYVCCGQEPYGGDGCGLYFCSTHAGPDGKCSPCRHGRPPYKAKPDHPAWTKHKATHPSWAEWRKDQAAQA